MSSILTTVTIHHGNILIASSIPVQIDNISLSVIASSGGAIPENTYQLYSLGQILDSAGNLLIQQGYLLTDEGTNAWNKDPRTTSGKAEYRVSGTVQVDELGELEVLIMRGLVKAA